MLLLRVPHSLRQLIWKTQQWPQDWKSLVCIPIAKKGNDKECSNYSIVQHIQSKTALISHASKVMPQILQARLQKYLNWELPDVQVRFIKGRGTKDQIATCWTIEKAREFQKNICFIDETKAFVCVDHKRWWKILKENVEYQITLPASWETCIQVKSSS